MEMEGGTKSNSRGDEGLLSLARLFLVRSGASSFEQMHWSLLYLRTVSTVSEQVRYRILGDLNMAPNSCTGTS
jgi:hypothetical protein